MIPELGHFALILALLVALAQGTLPLIGAATNVPHLMALARPAARAQALLVAIAFACLAWSFATNDFSVANVANNSNSELPLHYRIAATWGSHEGSLLLWTLMLAGWSLAVTLFSRNLPQPLLARVIAVMGLISVGFLLFLLFTSNPFERLLPPAADGRDLNPLLQDPGMVFHPPLLYMGYVGFSVAFAFAVAALIGGRLDSTWARWSRPWTTVAWSFLTDRHRAGLRLGVLHAGLGWVVVLGSGRERFVHAVAHRHRADPFAGGDREARRVSKLDGAARHPCVFAVAAGNLPGALGRADVGARLRDRSGARRVHPRLSGHRHRRFARVVRVARRQRRPRRRASAWCRASRCCWPTTSCSSWRWRACCWAHSIRCSSTRSTSARLSVGPPYFDAVFYPLMAPAAFLMGVGPIARWNDAPLPELWARLRWALGVALVSALHPAVRARALVAADRVRAVSRPMDRRERRVRACAAGSAASQRGNLLAALRANSAVVLRHAARAFRASACSSSA